MPNREKILKGLECCLGSNDCDIEPEENCPYKGQCLCAMALHYDILTLLKEQESKWASSPHKKDRFCERCGHDEPYKNAEEETKIFNYCPHCGARMTN